MGTRMFRLFGVDCTDSSAQGFAGRCFAIDVARCRPATSGQQAQGIKQNVHCPLEL